MHLLLGTLIYLSWVYLSGITYSLLSYANSFGWVEGSRQNMMDFTWQATALPLPEKICLLLVVRCCCCASLV